MRRGHSVEYPGRHRATSAGEIQNLEAVSGEGGGNGIRHCPERMLAIWSIQVLLRIPCG
jgi:hypothetical protein